MANVELFPVFGGVDMRDFRLQMGGQIVSLVGDGTTMTASYENGLTVIFHGTGLVAAGTSPTGGNVTGIDVQLSSQTVASYTGLTGWKFADVDNKSNALLNATPIVVHDTIGSDILVGGAKADRFQLGGGSEIFETWGADTVYGGAGNDTVILDCDREVAESGYDREHLLLMGEGRDTIIVRNPTVGANFLYLTPSTFSSVEVLDLRDGALVEINSTSFGINQISPVGVIKTNLATLQVRMDFDRDVTLAGMTIQGTMNQIAFYGNDLNNRITGNAMTPDRMDGKEGNDRLNGLGGRDMLIGGDGNDTLQGGAGMDRLTGGNGIDRFVFAPTGSRDRITDFTASGAEADVIDILKLRAITSFADLKAHHMRQDGADVFIEANGTTIVIAHTLMGDLEKSDFMI